MSPLKSKRNSSKKPSRLSQIANASDSTDEHVLDQQTPPTKTLTSHSSSQIASESTHLPQNGSNGLESQTSSTSGDINLPDKSFVGGASMSRETSLTESPTLVNSNENSSPIRSPVTPPDAAANEDDLNSKTSKTLPTDNYTDYSVEYSAQSEHSADVGSSSRRPIQVLGEDDGEPEHWSSLAQSPAPSSLNNPHRTPQEVVEIEGESSARTANTPPADSSTPSDLQAKARASLAQLRGFKGYDREAERRSLMPPPPTPKLKHLNIPSVPNTGPPEITKDGEHSVNSHSTEKNLQNVDAGVPKKVRFDDWALSVPRSDPAEDEEDSSDEESSVEDTYDSTRNNGSDNQTSATQSPSNSNQKTRRKAQDALHASQRSELRSALAKRQSLDHETALLCSKRYQIDQEIARLCAALGTPNEPGRSFDWRVILWHLDQQLQVVQKQRIRLHEQGEGTWFLDLEVVRLMKAMGVPCEAGFVAKRALSAQGETGRKKSRIE
ncbi:hypothetical protein N7G274_003476 [Stereocaulon virgatum]|uniref:Uncharacterized protein n=1 Tax=Stereocaulon virgatum TaxID=373712 RepID=A0ABR4AGI7_9LECA